MSESDQLAAQALELGVDLGPEETGRLRRFEALLAERAVPLRLIARSDAPRLRERHVLDSLRAAPVLADGTHVYDLGSGAGLPGVVVGIVRPEVEVALVERRSRRVAFLELAVRELGLTNVTVLPRSAEEVTEPADACLARAFAPLPETWRVARRLLRPSGRLVFFAGTDHDPADIPADATIEAVLRTPVLESSGPLVIMTRQ